MAHAGMARPVVSGSSRFVIVAPCDTIEAGVHAREPEWPQVETGRCADLPLDPTSADAGFLLAFGNDRGPVAGLQVRIFRL